MKKSILISVALLFIIGKMYAQTTPLVLTTTVTPATQCTAPCNGTATVTNVVGGTPPYTYLWNVTPPQQTQTATGLCPGSWQVGVWDATTPLPNQGTVLVTITCVTIGVNTLSSIEENISVYPNPAHHELYISITSELQGKVDLLIRNILGVVVSSESMDTNGNLYKWIDISLLPAGIYDVEFMNGNEIIQKKFIKQ